MKTVIIIPARYKSTRFPGKPLSLILGKPLILWVVEICVKALSVDRVYVATEDCRIKNVVEMAGYQVVMTSDKPLTGTDRIAEVIDEIDADIYINVQGDEPLVKCDDILRVIKEKERYPNCVIKGYCKIGDDEDPESLNIPKVIFTNNQKMIYMSRQIIPGCKNDDNVPSFYYKAVCIYGFSKKDLQNYKEFGGKSELEGYEDIEILRYLDIGTTVRLVEMDEGSLAVDIPEDILRVEAKLQQKFND